jgi:hypothetical protein
VTTAAATAVGRWKKYSTTRVAAAEVEADATSFG